MGTPIANINHNGTILRLMFDPQNGFTYEYQSQLKNLTPQQLLTLQDKGVITWDSPQYQQGALRWATARVQPAPPVQPPTVQPTPTTQLPPMPMPMPTTMAVPAPSTTQVAKKTMSLKPILIGVVSLVVVGALASGGFMAFNAVSGKGGGSPLSQLKEKVGKSNPVAKGTWTPVSNNAKFDAFMKACMYQAHGETEANGISALNGKEGAIIEYKWFRDEPATEDVEGWSGFTMMDKEELQIDKQGHLKSYIWIDEQREQADDDNEYGQIQGIYYTGPKSDLDFHLSKHIGAYEGFYYDSDVFSFVPIPSDYQEEISAKDAEFINNTINTIFASVGYEHKADIVASVNRDFKRFEIDEYGLPMNKLAAEYQPCEVNKAGDEMSCSYSSKEDGTGATIQLHFYKDKLCRAVVCLPR